MCVRVCIIKSHSGGEHADNTHLEKETTKTTTTTAITTTETTTTITASIKTSTAHLGKDSECSCRSVNTRSTLKGVVAPIVSW